MDLNQFFNQWNGKFADFDGSYPNQCVDLVNFYNRDVVGNQKKVSGNGWQWHENAPQAYYTKVSNPQKGDIAIWKQEFGGYGHVAIVWDNGKFFSQNYPLKAPCSLQSIPTNKILGYLRPTTMTKAQVIDIWRAVIHADPSDAEANAWVGKNVHDCIKHLLEDKKWQKQNWLLKTLRDELGAEKL